MSSDVLYTALLVTDPLRRVTPAQLFDQTLSHFVHLSGKIDGLDAFQYCVVNVHGFLTAERWPDRHEKKKSSPEHNNIT